jgi:hypothetical protein
MSNITLYTNDENATTGIREASFEEILDCARRALAKRVRRGTGFTSPRVTADYLRVRLSSLDHEVFCVIYLTKRHQFIACEDLFRGTIDGASVYPREVLKKHSSTMPPPSSLPTITPQVLPNLRRPTSTSPDNSKKYSISSR